MSEFDINDSAEETPEETVPEETPIDDSLTEEAVEEAATSDAASDEGAQGFEPLATPKGAKHSRLNDILPQIGDADPVPQVAEAPIGLDEAVGQPEERKRRRWPLVLLAMALLLVGVYFAGAVVFMNVFLPNTTINGEDVSLQTVGSVAQTANDASDSLSLDVKGEGMDLQVSAKAVKARYDGKAYAKQAMAQQKPWSWPLQVTREHELSVERKLSYDTMLLNDMVSSAVDAVNKDAEKPKDAEISYDKKAKRYEVKPEEAGTLLDKTAVTDAVRKALEEQQTSLELGDEVLVKPEVLSDDKELNEAVDSVNACLDATQTIMIKGETVATVDDELLSEWVGLNDKHKVTFDDEACTKWAREDLSVKLDTIGSTRTFDTPDGRTLTISGGTYGWNCNGTQIAKEIEENVKAGDVGEIEVSWITEAAKWNPGGNEWGDTFVEIDLGAQHVRYFQNGKVTWEADCVSGGPNIDGKDRTTPPGIYYINDNMRSGHIELRGENDPKTGKPTYISYVDYWMPFIGDSVALHDADWRSSFGGDIYLTNGSHGCVNLPVDKATKLYGMVGVGTVVVVHG